MNNFSCRNVAEESFADLYKVEGLRGIYIASKVVTKPSGVNIGPEHLMSYISFDHGNTWGPIKPPKQDDEGQPINCVLVDDCSLHLSQKFSQLYPVTRLYFKSSNFEYLINTFNNSNCCF